jgi:outer membrane receptor protein involved in Fe transport
VPLNLFGFGSPSAAALAWVTGTTVQDQIVKQDVAEVSIGGSPFSSWAGPVSVAAGGGYRRESSAQTVDDTATLLRHFTGDYRGWPTALEGQLGGWERTNPQPLAGHYDVKEAFAEVGIPLLVDSPLGESLELNGAIRYTDYSTSGEVTTWKTGLVYRPIADIQLRATLSRDIRAANINEMFTGPTQGQANLTDPAYPVGDPNNRPVVIARSFGNPVLKPERADTTAVGVILRPRFLPGFTASIDYYDIDIRDAINTLGSQTIIDQCFQGATALCSLLHRDSTGVLVSVDTPYLNIARRATDGIDLETAYQIQLGSGMLNVRGLATYIHKLTTENPGAAVIDAAGQTGGGGGVPHWMANLSADWKTSGGFGLFVQERYIGPGALDKTLPATTLDPAANHVASVFYTDLTLSRQFGTPNEHHLNAQAFFTISNLFNRAPPMAPAAYFVFGASNGGTNASLFDIVGRQYTAGIRLRF